MPARKPRRGVKSRPALRGHFSTGLNKASSGEDAVRDVERLSPQLVVMDVAMLGMGGIATARMILRRFSEVVILMISVDDPKRHLKPEARSERIACLEKRALRANELSFAWGTLSHGRPG